MQVKANNAQMQEDELLAIKMQNALFSQEQATEHELTMEELKEKMNKISEGIMNISGQCL